jgi:hypothetical protein
VKHTEVYVEQVIIGFCVLVTVDLLLNGRLRDFSDKAIVAGAIVIGAAYVVGILYDRCADSLLDRLDRWHRLAYAYRDIPMSSSSKPIPSRRTAASLSPATRRRI